MPKTEDIDAGQAVYSPLVLKAYDAFVLGFSNRCLWRCPTAHLRALYDRNVSARHLDIGVGTGYFLDKAAWPAAAPEITLLDLNPNALHAAARRIARFRPRTVRANALAPLPPLGPFDSVGLCYLLHCLPGLIEEKAALFDHLRPALAPGARIFGATIVQGDAPRSKPAQALMNFYNRKGIFSNAQDTRQALAAALEARFAAVKIELSGAVALFEARAA
ncbi:MAG: class I SAM-dependent methyltransferase [Rhodospirillaceae bacterium]|nr:class I SAM-dependent methyltransferase [Rhodospirillaceae bacterium]